MSKVIRNKARLKVLLYARVSQEAQNKEDRVSIDQQIEAMRDLCKRSNWHILGEFVDAENYTATQSPKRGKVVNPSGERADRPAFLEMLEIIKSGEADVVLCWRDDRLVRHPRVTVALEDALDIGDSQRKGKDKIQVQDATGAMIDRFTLSIKASIWREENKRRAERVRMGKVATLQQGGWPGYYNRLGYSTRRIPGRRGRVIELADEQEVQLVKDIFSWCDSGLTLKKIRRRLIARSAQQKGNGKLSRKREWHPAVIGEVLRAEDYMGETTWRFADGQTFVIKIPQIIPVDLWQRVQKQLDRNRRLATRNSGGVYLLQNIFYCGECGGKVSPRAIRYFYKTLADGTKKRYEHKSFRFQYRCVIASSYPNDPHPRPACWTGKKLDYAVWRAVVDQGIKRPDLIRKQVLARQAELQAERNDVNGDIAQARHGLSNIEQERAFYQRQAARGMITEAEFDARMEETQDARRYWESELARLTELRDDTKKVQAGLDYATLFLTGLNDRLSEIDIPPEELKALPLEQQNRILKERRKIIRALIERVLIYASGLVKIEGMLDGAEAGEFELGVS